MVSRLVDKDAGNRTLEEEIMSGSKGPDVSERVQMVMAILRPTTRSEERRVGKECRP